MLKQKGRKQLNSISDRSAILQRELCCIFSSHAEVELDNHAYPTVLDTLSPPVQPLTIAVL